MSCDVKCERCGRPTPKFFTVPMRSGLFALVCPPCMDTVLHAFGQAPTPWRQQLPALSERVTTRSPRETPPVDDSDSSRDGNLWGGREGRPAPLTEPATDRMGATEPDARRGGGVEPPSGQRNRRNAAGAQVPKKRLR